ncbi:hypothetical protein EIP91_008036, partial [Steccherinum ochraceum]
MPRAIKRFNSKSPQKRRANIARAQPLGVAAAAAARALKAGRDPPIFTPPSPPPIPTTPTKPPKDPSQKPKLTPKSRKIKALDDFHKAAARTVHNVTRQFQRLQKKVTGSTTQSASNLPPGPTSFSESSGIGHLAANPSEVPGANSSHGPSLVFIPPVVGITPFDGIAQPDWRDDAFFSPPEAFDQTQLDRLRMDKDALRKRLERTVTQLVALEKENAALREKRDASRGTYSVKDGKGVVTPETRQLIRHMVQLGTPMENVFKIICAVLGVACVDVEGSFSGQTVHRVVLEGGVLATLQIA